MFNTSSFIGQHTSYRELLIFKHINKIPTQFIKTSKFTITNVNLVETIILSFSLGRIFITTFRVFCEYLDFLF